MGYGNIIDSLSDRRIDEGMLIRHQVVQLRK